MVNIYLLFYIIGYLLSLILFNTSAYQKEGITLKSLCSSLILSLFSWIIIILYLWDWVDECGDNIVLFKKEEKKNKQIDINP